MITTPLLCRLLRATTDRKTPSIPTVFHSISGPPCRESLWRDRLTRGFWTRIRKNNTVHPDAIGLLIYYKREESDRQRKNCAEKSRSSAVMFGVCSNRRSQSSMFLFPFQCWTSVANTLTTKTPPDSDVIPEVDVVSVQCRQKLDSSDSVFLEEAETSVVDADDCSCSDVDVMTSRPNSAADDDDDNDDDVTVTSAAVTSPSKELKFGIDRILIKNNDARDASPIGIVFFCNFRRCGILIGFNNYSASICIFT